MIILSNCLTQTVDEGSLNVANSLIKRIKKIVPETTIVSYERQSELSDKHLHINKLLLNRQLIQLLWKRKEPVLYVPFPARMLPTALRIFILSQFARWGLQTVLVMQGSMGKLSRWLIKASHSRILAVSRSTWEIYRELIGSRAVYLKAGVDIKRFCPVNDSQKAALREKYDLPTDKSIVLHVGHLNAGRNIGQLANVADDFHIVLVVSTLTANERDAQLRKYLEMRGNITILDTYLPNIEEVYQLSDVYLFPVEQAGNCIDVPLSALEAAACDIPVVATPFGELKELLGKEGFYEIPSFEPEVLNALLKRACEEEKSARRSVLEYDWKLAVDILLSDNKQEE